MIQHLQQVFTNIQSVVLKLYAKMCQMAPQEVTFLGHCVSMDGVRSDPDFFQAIHEISSAANQKELSTFLGLDGYYRKFIRKFLTTAAPLHGLSAEDIAW